MDRFVLGDLYAFVAAIVFMGCFTGVLITYLKRHDRRAVGDKVTSRLDEIAEKLERLDTAVDAMAVEVERVSEAQRFTAKVLADRHGSPALPEKNRGTVTPH